MLDLLYPGQRGLGLAAAVLVLALVLVLAGPVAAQPSAGLASARVPAAAPTAHPRPDPSDARAPVPAQVHRSAFSTYQRASDAPLGTWRDLNDATARAGGWRAYARETAEGRKP